MILFYLHIKFLQNPHYYKNENVNSGRIKFIITIETATDLIPVRIKNTFLSGLSHERQRQTFNGISLINLRVILFFPKNPSVLRIRFKLVVPQIKKSVIYKYIKVLSQTIKFQKQNSCRETLYNQMLTYYFFVYHSEKLKHTYMHTFGIYNKLVFM